MAEKRRKVPQLSVSKHSTKTVQVERAHGVNAILEITPPLYASDTNIETREQ
ncbi:hypothetical protein CY34DRAFT_19974 [Suillus luteus UH-Slu-Lm8-n1]|uniref:Uncharacterized protein n=1 Tax=Suillus luteus UH-Slu-Lm8-n1 TaxID=930992 RepID=A0A0D0AAY3_9AGAM|nr:hypothetical protein CY34DRAFT_19974 [Suillus luteus UH-Slu-Lm8-n1]